MLCYNDVRVKNGNHMASHTVFSLFLGLKNKSSYFLVYEYTPLVYKYTPFSWVCKVLFLSEIEAGDANPI